MKYPTHTPSGIELRDNELGDFAGCDRPDTECAWTALERLALVADAAGCPFHPHAFMFMGTEAGPRGETIHLYKHSDTRRYVNVDAAGHAYRYHATGTGYAYSPHVSPAVAIAEAYE